MAEPVLVVHGVANRDRGAFEAQVSELGRKIGSTWQLIPVFWGDLGGQNIGVEDTLPSFAAVRAGELGIDPAIVEAILGGGGPGADQPATRGATDPQSAILDGVYRAGPDMSTRAAEDVEALRQAVRDELPNTRYLQVIRNRAVLEAVGRALGSMPAPSRGQPVGPYGNADASADTRGLRDTITNASRAMLHSLDELVGTVIGETLGPMNEGLRAYAANPFIQFFGDIIAYQRNQQAIHQRLWDAIERSAPGYGTREKPINLIGHSLGGVASFDATLDATRPLWIKTFITFGSQAPFFHIIDPRRTISAYAHGSPVALPNSIGDWVNLWEPLDFLAFSASRVFRLASGGSPRDVEVNHLASYGLYTHSVYWGVPELVDSIRTAMV